MAAEFAVARATAIQIIIAPHRKESMNMKNTSAADTASPHWFTTICSPTILTMALS